MPCRLADLLSLLEDLAPRRLAADWDNVGLLVEPFSFERASVSRALLTIDLTEAVLAEALEQRVELIIAYHPPIFRGLKRLTQATASERVVLGAAAAGVFVYSPHTALDACRGGLNDWLISAFTAEGATPIEPAATSIEEGQGRQCLLEQPLTLEAAVGRVKRLLDLKQLRVARPHGVANPEIRSVAVCAGAGGSVLEGVDADLLLTGELRHHDILVRQSRAQCVIVCDHTNTERGYLKLLAKQLAEGTAGVEFRVSEVDADPLHIE